MPYLVPYLCPTCHTLGRVVPYLPYLVFRQVGHELS